MDDLIAFLKARLDEDEAAAAVEDNSEPWPGQWEADGNYGVRTYNGHVLVYGHDRDLKPGLAAHIARHDPARVLREVEAKRQMLTRWEFARNQVAVHAINGSFDEAEAWDKITGGLELDNRAIAAVWSDHPDYRAEWKP